MNSRTGLRTFRGIALIVLTTLLSWQRGDAASRTIWVNDDASIYTWPGKDCETVAYATIQAAINIASPGDIIMVCPGTYTENLSVNKSLSITSTDGFAYTRIKAPLNLPVVQISAPNVRVEGFDMIALGNGKLDIGVNVAIEGTANAQIANNVVSYGRIGINLGCSSRASTIYGNVVRGPTEAGINVDTCELEGNLPGSNDNDVHHNRVCVGALKPYSIAVGGGKATNNHIHHNVAKWITVAGRGNQAHDNLAESFNIDSGNVDINNVVGHPCS